MANLNFKYGLADNLASVDINNGTIYVTTDQRSMYVDLEGQRIRLGDFLTYDSFDALQQDESHWDENTLVYIKPPYNILAKYSASGVPQFDKDGKPVMGEDGKQTTGAGWIKINDSESLQAELSELEEIVGQLSETFTEYSTTVNERFAAVDQAIAAETKARGEAIAAETKARGEAIAAEAKTRGEAIAAEAKTRGEAITNLQGQITNNDADITDLYGKIQTETTNRTNAISELKTQIETQMQTADAMTFKGVLSETSTVDKTTYLSLPVGSSTVKINAGDTYKVGVSTPTLIPSGKIEGVTGNVSAYVGDLLIAVSDQGNSESYTGKWYHISSGYEDDYNAKIVQHPDTSKYGFGLAGGAGENRGSVSFTSDNLTISQTPVVNESTGVTTNTINISLTWGTFGTT